MKKRPVIFTEDDPELADSVWYTGVFIKWVVNRQVLTDNSYENGAMRYKTYPIEQHMVLVEVTNGPKQGRLVEVAHSNIEFQDAETT